MKRTIILTLSVAFLTITALIVFNKLASKKKSENLFAESVKGDFEIAISGSGELLPENSLDIKAPEISRGRDFHAADLKIQDLVPEGTIVNKGDYVATLDRTQFDNTLKDEQERLSTYRTNLEMKGLDTAVTLTALRDGIRNQRQAVEEAEIILRNSQYEPPATIREAEINFDRQKRLLEQKKRGYTLRVAQAKRDMRTQRLWYNRIDKRVMDLEEVLAGFIINAPGPGMVVYKKDHHGTKIKTGSSVNAFDRTVATLPDLSTMISKIYVSEIEIRKVKPDLVAEVTIDAFPGKKYTGRVVAIANIGEKLPNSDTKVFEVQIRLDGSDPSLRPSMTTTNKIIVTTYRDVVYVPIECVHAGPDGIPFVYTGKNTRQVVVPGDSNEKNIVIEKGLKPGELVYLAQPDNIEKFRLTGLELAKLE
ncbi:MAG: efflux RND transporter periplasmic adaptor subunit [Bacteroidales bacterium]